MEQGQVHAGGIEDLQHAAVSSVTPVAAASSVTTNSTVASQAGGLLADGVGDARPARISPWNGWGAVLPPAPELAAPATASLAA